jgi:hypothetical protein
VTIQRIREALYDDALTFVRGLAVTTTASIESLLNAIAQRFGPTGDVFERQRLFRTCTQSPEEDVLTFERRLTRLGHEWKPEISNTELLDGFRAGLFYTSARKKTAGTTIFEIAVSRARDEEVDQAA